MAEKILKKDIVRRMSADLDMTQKRAEVELNYVLDVISEYLQDGTNVALKDFGTFEVKATKPRAGINPTTKEKIDVPSKKVIKFKVSKALKESVK